MTCVVTLAIVNDGRLTIGHVGDSRLYKLGPEGMQKLTHDHSPVGEREDAQEIAEIDAMRHPRRHEVFRDVGGALRDKDEDDYVEVVEDVLERDTAILLCTDGLTDMVPSTTIERLVRRHAGAPDAVVEALVSAANDAGGRDNVTVVYAEGPDFARAVRGRSPNGAPAAPPRLSDNGVDSEPTERRVEAQPGRVVLSLDRAQQDHMVRAWSDRRRAGRPSARLADAGHRDRRRTHHRRGIERIVHLLVARGGRQRGARGRRVAARARHVRRAGDAWRRRQPRRAGPGQRDVRSAVAPRRRLER